MKKTLLFTSVAVLVGLAAGSSTVFAAEEEVFPKELSSKGTITFTPGEGEVTPPVDPEEPGKPIDPEDPPSGMSGTLTLDFVSKLNFEEQKISTKDKYYYAAPTNLKNGDKVANYVQVSDKRGTLAGWTLNVRQKEKFKTPPIDGKVYELTGAQLTLPKGTAQAADSQLKAPKGEKVILGEGYQKILAAQENTGVGTWTYRFGDLAEYKNGVAEVSDNELDDSRPELMVPGSTTQLAKTYETTLEWTLSNEPGQDAGI